MDGRGRLNTQGSGQSLEYITRYDHVTFWCTYQTQTGGHRGRREHDTSTATRQNDMFGHGGSMYAAAAPSFPPPKVGPNGLP